jgi:hypothetical protein
MGAFATAEKPHLAFIGRTKLAEPPERSIMFAFRTFGRDGGESRDRGILNNRKGAIRGLCGSPKQILVLRGLDVPTLAAFHLPTGRDQHTFTLRAEHEYKYFLGRVIKSLLIPKTPRLLSSSQNPFFLQWFI